MRPNGLCRVSARQPSDFLLLAQEKVTKEKGTPAVLGPPWTGRLPCGAGVPRASKELALMPAARATELKQLCSTALARGNPRTAAHRRRHRWGPTSRSVRQAGLGPACGARVGAARATKRPAAERAAGSM